MYAHTRYQHDTSFLRVGRGPRRPGIALCLCWCVVVVGSTSRNKRGYGFTVYRVPGTVRTPTALSGPARHLTPTLPFRSGARTQICGSARCNEIRCSCYSIPTGNANCRSRLGALSTQPDRDLRTPSICGLPSRCPIGTRPCIFAYTAFGAACAAAHRQVDAYHLERDTAR